MSTSNISRNRKRNPIVSVYLTSNPSIIFSIVVPKSKDWIEFLQKCSEKLHFNVEKVINVQIIDEENDEETEEYEHAISQDMTQNMKHLKHTQVIAIEAVEEFPVSSDEGKLFQKLFSILKVMELSRCKQTSFFCCQKFLSSEKLFPVVRKKEVLVLVLLRFF